MVSSIEQDLVYDIKVCSVGPGKMSGHNVVHEPTYMDLAMKLHYLRAVYFFSNEAELTLMKLKETTFTLLNYYFIPCGRLRRSDSGRPYIKCNDCGVRFVEALCRKTIEEWLEMKNDANNLDKLLVPRNFIGPELPYSPTVFIQVTSFKCGGVSLGLGWSHVLGDAFSAFDFMNSWGQVIAGLAPKIQVKTPNNIEKHESQSFLKDAIPAKRIDNVGDLWTFVNNTQMMTFSLSVTSSQLKTLKCKVFGHDQTDFKIPSFESLCAVIWQCIAKVKGDQEPRTVTLCRKDHKRIVGELSNYGTKICTVKAGFTIHDACTKDLATLLMDNVVDERKKIEEAVKKEEDKGGMDFIIYGTNLTFVDMVEADLYGFVCHGHKPMYVNYSIEGVGDEGMILVLPESSGSSGVRGRGRVINITLPENQALKVKSELERELFII